MNWEYSDAAEALNKISVVSAELRDMIEEHGVSDESLQLVFPAFVNEIERLMIIVKGYK